MEFKPAKRTGIIPLVGIFGKSGTGKTYSAIRVMRGIIGPSGKMGCIDTENGRLSINVDRVPEGMKAPAISSERDVILDMQPPFHPAAYFEALGLAFQQNIDGLVIDSATHEWVGYLQSKEDWIDDKLGNEKGDWKKRDKLAIPAAARCKPAHNRFVSELLRARLPIILCFRGKDKIKMDKEKFTGYNGKEMEKTVIIAPEHSSPIQDSGLIYEMLIALETLGDDENTAGGCRVTKYTHPDLLQCLPSQGERLCERTGELIAQWCRDPGPKAPTQPTFDRKATMSRLTELSKRDHFDGKLSEFFGYLRKQGIIKDGENSTKDLTDERLAEVLKSAREALQ